MFCSNCGSNISDNALSCTSCGEPVNKASKTPINKNIFLFSYIASIFFPIIGYFLSIYFLIKNNVVHAVGIAVISIFSTFFWYGLWTTNSQAANFTWSCQPTGVSSLQCEITNTGIGTGAVTFDIVAICDGQKYLATIDSGLVATGGVVQRVAEFTPTISPNQVCAGFEYHNEKIK